MVVLVRLPDVPVTVKGYCPMAAELLAVSVSMLIPVVGFGFHNAVTPVGRPETEKLTLPANPYCEFTQT